MHPRQRKNTTIFSHKRASRETDNWMDSTIQESRTNLRQHKGLLLCISCRASGPERQKHESAQKVGFLPIPERAPKSALFAHFFTHFLHKKCGFAHFWALFLESAETPLFVQIHVFALRALRLDRKYTKVDLWSIILPDFVWHWTLKAR